MAFVADADGPAFTLLSQPCCWHFAAPSFLTVAAPPPYHLAQRLVSTHLTPPSRTPGLQQLRSAALGAELDMRLHGRFVPSPAAVPGPHP